MRSWRKPEEAANNDRPIPCLTPHGNWKHGRRSKAATAGGFHLVLDLAIDLQQFAEAPLQTGSIATKPENLDSRSRLNVAISV